MTKTTEQVPSNKSGMIAIFHCNPIASFIKIFMVGLLLVLTSIPDSAHARKYDSNIENLKFRYGAYSTLVSSYVLGVMCRDNKYPECNGIIDKLNDPYADLGEIKNKINGFKSLYESLSDEQVDEIIKLAREDQTPSIYEEERSVVSTIIQNDAFNNGMAQHPKLNPVNNLVDDGHFTSENFQFSVHRALYNDAFGIPQNSLAAIVNAYVAGIRNVEFDVLDTGDNMSILIHDLVTNRIEGDYYGHPKYVEDLEYDQVKDTAVHVLNPLGSQPAFENTNVKMITTARVLEVVHELMPEMTLYLDARNYAPLSIIRILTINPKYKNNVVLKIYPFLLNGGMTSLVKIYADRYMGGYEKGAIDEIAAVNPNVLLAIGHAEMEANQDAAHGGINQFTWQAFQDQTRFLPFSHNSELNYTHFNNNVIFTTEEINEIEMRTFLLFRWTMGLTGITNTMVIQMGAIPSLKEVITRGDIGEYTKMAEKKNKEDLISAAAHDNFIALYRMVMSGTLNLQVDGCVNETCNLLGRIAHTKFGLSDRYPDFAFADRMSQGEVNDLVVQDSLQSFNYNMLGTGYKTVGYQPEKVRSTKAITDRIIELNRLTYLGDLEEFNKLDELKKLTEGRVKYITTDLEIDLRLAFMGLLGQADLPADVRHRAGGVIKESYQINPVDYTIPLWLTRLSGGKHQNIGPSYKDDLDKISDAQKEIDRLKQLRHSLQRTYYDDLPLTNKEAWKTFNINTVATRNTLNKDLLKFVIKKTKEEIDKNERSIEDMKKLFTKNYGVRFISERSIQDQN